MQTVLLPYLIKSITNNYKENDIVEINKNEFDKFILTLNENSYFTRGITFKSVIDFVKKYVFDKHQSIITGECIFILITEALEYKLDILCDLDSYNIIDELSKFWLKKSNF